MNEILEEKGNFTHNLFFKMICFSMILFIVDALYNASQVGIIFFIAVLIMSTIFCIPLTIMTLQYMYVMPYKLILDNEKLLLKRRIFKDIELPLENIKSIEKQTAKSLISHIYAIDYKNNNEKYIFLDSAYYRFPEQDFNPFIEELQRRVDNTKSQSEQ